MEYRVKAGETYTIAWVFTENGMYNSSERRWSDTIKPESGHTYEVTLGGNYDDNDVVITDVTATK